ncbi:baseplate assembly protein [Enterobacter sp. CGMCC 5087]|uniref:GPW/gp25 family protein n=1 Tax=Enterobacter sp. CGMCC 5087 TaxID=2183878 RepID=UPI000D679C1F|nr:GPW/gp25 family protein [Enterobacter sp. CGMCC 5087]PWI80490.1 baseplate assembly protein [Enterobacter sp. CGMCC 5087]
MTSHYAGLNRDSGGMVTDEAHIQQSVTDILTTPKGTRLMLRDYGSDVPAMIDGPLTDSLRLRVIAATYEALTAWEPRISLSSVTTRSEKGATQVIVKGYSLSGQPLNITTTFSRGQS